MFATVQKGNWPRKSESCPSAVPFALTNDSALQVPASMESCGDKVIRLVPQA